MDACSGKQCVTAADTSCHKPAHTSLWVLTSAHLPVGVVDHDIVGFDVSMHDSHAMTIVQCSQKLIQVVTNVIVCQLLI